jgi:hypothetical protein
MQEYSYTDNGSEIVEWIPVGPGCGLSISDCLAKAKAAGLTWDESKLPVEEPTQAERIKLAEAHIARHFTAFGLMEGLKKLMTAQMSGNLAAVPKTLAVATWVETVKAMAMAGQLDLPEPPHTFDEIVVE